MIGPRVLLGASDFGSEKALSALIRVFRLSGMIPKLRVTTRAGLPLRNKRLVAQF